MLIEALTPLHIRLAAGDLHLSPGQPVCLDEADAAKLLAKAGDRVRAVQEHEPIKAGDKIEWDGWDLGKQQAVVLYIGHIDGTPWAACALPSGQHVEVNLRYASLAPKDDPKG